MTDNDSKVSKRENPFSLYVSCTRLPLLLLNGFKTNLKNHANLKKK